MAECRVLISISPTQWESEHWVVIRNTRERDMFEWLRERDHHLGLDYQYSFIKCIGDRGAHAYVFEFQDQAMAILFKLVWG